MTTLHMFRGDSTRIMSTVKDEDTGAPLDLAPFRVTFTMKKRVSDSDAAVTVIQKDTVEGSVQTDANIVTVFLSPSDTEDFPDAAQRMLWDIQIVSAAGDVYTIDQGDILITPDITRSHPLPP